MTNLMRGTVDLVEVEDMVVEMVVDLHSTLPVVAEVGGREAGVEVVEE